MTVGTINPRRITLQGELLKVETVALPSSVPHSAKRGKVSEFSDASRLRMLEMFARFDRSWSGFADNSVKFITLTYPHNMKNTIRAKRDLKVFIQRIRREFPECWLVWRFEKQKRGAIHFHIMLGGVGFWDVSQAQDAWNEVSETTARNSLDMQTVETLNGVMFYVSKYMSKPDGETPKMGDSELGTLPSGWVQVYGSSDELGLRGYSYVHVETGEMVHTPLQARQSDGENRARNGVAPLGLSVSQNRPHSQNAQGDGWVGRFWGVSGREFLPLAPLQEFFAVFADCSWKWLLSKMDSEYCRPNTGFVLFGEQLQAIFDACKTTSERWFNLDAVWEWSQFWQNWGDAMRTFARDAHDIMSEKLFDYKDKKANAELAFIAERAREPIAFVPAHMLDVSELVALRSCE